MKNIKNETTSRIHAEFIEPIRSSSDKKNFGELAEKICSQKESRLYTLSKNQAEYIKYCRMFSGELKTIVDTSSLNISLLQNAVSFFKEKEIVCNIHDGSPIRKPESKTLDALGKVKSLNNKIVNGYDTFNSVMVDVKGHSIRLLSTTPFSNGEPNFVGVAERYDYENGQIKDKARRDEITMYDTAGTSFNQKDIVFNQLRNINVSIKSENPTLTIIDIFDRGFDDSELFDLEEELGNEFIVRGKCNRKSNGLQLDENGKEKAIKLVKQQFFKGEEKVYSKITFRGKKYKDAKGVFEWNEAKIKEKTYSILKVSFYEKNGTRIFKDDMLLITSMFIDDIQMAMTIWELYMQRTKIESVFKFCKQELGWETPRMNDWTTMRNLLSMVYFIAGYFYEIEHELTNDPTSQWLAKLGDGKGKVTIHFILKGLAKIIAYLEIKSLIDQNIVNEQDIKNATKIYSARKNL